MSLQEAQTLFEAYHKQSTRRSLQCRRWDLLNDECQKHVYSAIDARYTDSNVREEMKRCLDLSNNCYRFIVNLLSIVYREPARRYFADPSDNEVLALAIDGADLDNSMERVNQITMALNECFVRPVVRRGKVELDIISPHTAEVLADGPHLTAILYPIENDCFAYWDQFAYIQLDTDGKPLTTQPNPYGVVPFVTYRRMKPLTGFWVGTAGEDLVALYVNQALERSRVDRIAEYQSFKQLAYKPSDLEAGMGAIPQEQLAGPSGILTGDYSVLDLKTDMKSFYDVIESKLRRTAANYGISAEALTSSKYSSGLERLLSNASLLEQRLATIKLFRPSDLELMRLIARVWNEDCPVGSPLFSSLLDPRIDYAEPTLIKSELDAVTVLAKEIQMHISTPVDYLLGKNPDLTYEQAMELARHNMTVNTELFGQITSEVKIGRPEESSAITDEEVLGKDKGKGKE